MSGGREFFLARIIAFFQSIVVSLRQEVIETYKDEKMQKRLWKEGSFEQGI